MLMDMMSGDVVVCVFFVMMGLLCIRIIIVAVQHERAIHFVCDEKRDADLQDVRRRCPSAHSMIWKISKWKREHFIRDDE